jgi:hypothetical protein
MAPRQTLLPHTANSAGNWRRRERGFGGLSKAGKGWGMVTICLSRRKRRADASNSKGGKGLKGSAGPVEICQV